MVQQVSSKLFVKILSSTIFQNVLTTLLNERWRCYQYSVKKIIDGAGCARFFLVLEKPFCAYDGCTLLNAAANVGRKEIVGGFDDMVQ